MKYQLFQFFNKFLSNFKESQIRITILENVFLLSRAFVFSLKSATVFAVLSQNHTTEKCLNHKK